ncbi:MAG: D-alanyl-D-alanine carboxypeptidase [Clostridia bacterium]|nr:D-alanyl-D-alanine carboxypeptidase [Clostridia bacterium]
MNITAKELGMKNSRLLNPDGYDAEGQYTTAEDLLLLSKAAVENELIKRVCGAYRSNAYLADGNGVTWYNTNKMLNPNDAFYRPEATGLKTGSTKAAGSCIIVSFTRSGREYIAAVLEATSDTQRYRTAAALIDSIS